MEERGREEKRASAGAVSASANALPAPWWSAGSALTCGLRAGERSTECPRILGIDEHFFTRRRGYATTFCDLRNQSVYDVVVGRSEAALETYLNRLLNTKDRRVTASIMTSVYSLDRSRQPADFNHRRLKY